MRMYLDAVLNRFVQKSPVTVMTRACLEHALDPDALNALFERHAECQYTKSLLFSSLVDLMGLVVCRIQPAVSAAYRAMAEDLPVTLTAVYEKLNGTEASVRACLREDLPKVPMHGTRRQKPRKKETLQHRHGRCAVEDPGTAGPRA